MYSASTAASTYTSATLTVNMTMPTVVNNSSCLIRIGCSFTANELGVNDSEIPKMTLTNDFVWEIRANIGFGETLFSKLSYIRIICCYVSLRRRTNDQM